MSFLYVILYLYGLQNSFRYPDLQVFWRKISIPLFIYFPVSSIGLIIQESNNWLEKIGMILTGIEPRMGLKCKVLRTLLHMVTN